MNKLVKIFMLTALLPIVLLADAKANAEIFGAFTLLPPAVAIILAFITRNVIFSLFLGIFTGTFMLNIMNDGNVFLALGSAFVDISAKMVGSMADSWNAGIILQVLTIGGMIAVITKMGGPRAIAQKMAAKAKTPASAQIYTWLMGFFIFFDDYANALIIGPIMKTVTDKLKVAREKLAFVIDATAAPIAGIALISTWVGYEISLIKDAYVMIGQTDINAYAVFVETIPYRFYNILMLGFVFFSAYFLREFGPMHKAALRAHTTGAVSNHTNKENLNQESSTLAPKEDVEYSIWNAIVPIVSLIVVALVGFYFNGLNGLEGEALKTVQENPYSFTSIRDCFGAADASIVLFEAALFASIVAIAMGMYQKIFSLSEALETWVLGVKALVITAVILILAWSISAVIKELGASTYLVSLLSNSTPEFVLPSIIFIMGSIISFSTGTSYGTMGILMPLTIPLANAIGMNTGLEGADLSNYIILNISAVLTGAIFGDHCSPISDTSILSSMGASCDHMDHISTQLPYALFVGVISIVFGYIPAAFGYSATILLPVGLITIALVIRFYGKPYINQTA